MLLPLLLPPPPSNMIIPPSSWLWWGWLGRVGAVGGAGGVGGGVEEVGVGVGVGMLGAWSSVMIVWIRGLSWMIVGPVAGLAFFVVFRRFHVGELSCPVFVFFFFFFFFYFFFFFFKFLEFVCWICVSPFFVLFQRKGNGVKRLVVRKRFCYEPKGGKER